MSRPATPAIDRLMARISHEDRGHATPCWIFTGYCDWAGYGKIGVGSGVQSTHRVAYESLVGPIPDGLQIDHLCRVPACCNPAHLEPVTSAENTWRGLKGVLLTHCPRGHEYSPENTYRIRHQGGHGRRCRACELARLKAWYATNRAVSRA